MSLSIYPDPEDPTVVITVEEWTAIIEPTAATLNSSKMRQMK